MNKVHNAVADPGFPVGGMPTRRGRFLAEMYVKMKELVPVGWEGEGRWVDVACTGCAPYIRL